MSSIAVGGIALLLVVSACALHYEALRFAARLIPRLGVPPRRRILVVIAIAFVAHLLEICLYAFAFWGMEVAGLGRIGGAIEGGALDYFYFSNANFTTLGVGDLLAEGPMRVVAGIESLNGLVLITWSASFTYISMEKFWEDHG